MKDIVTSLSEATGISETAIERHLAKARNLELLAELSDAKAKAMEIPLPLVAACRVALLYNQQSLRSVMEETPLTSSSDVAKYLIARIGHREREQLGIVYLTTKNTCIAIEELFAGGLDACAVDERVVLRNVLMHNAAGVVLYHNHPSGDCEPSRNDIRLTRKLLHGLKAIGVRLLDHLIVSGNSYRSIKELGLI